VGAVGPAPPRPADPHDVAVGLIAIVSRGYGPSSATRTAEFATRWRHALVGFDLADDEVSVPPAAFADAVARARAAGLAVTVHSGEGTAPAYVRESLEHFDPRRIGHGVAVADDPALIDRVVAAGVALEMCPTSNERTRAVPSLRAHPARELLRRGVAVTLNSDDPALFGIDLTHEWRVAREALGFTDADLARATGHALAASFLPPARVREVAARHFKWVARALAE
jgi:adenosine deaminase